MKKAVLFDMDGVLVDSEPYNDNQLIEFSELFGLPQHPKGFFIGSGEPYLWEQKVGDDPERIAYLKQEIKKFRESVETPYADLLDPEVHEVFRKIKEKGLKTAIASSSPLFEIEEVMKVAKIEDLVDFHISGHSCKKHKPDPEIYLTALKALDVKAEDAIGVEDSIPGIQAAKSAGLFVCGRIPRTPEYAIDQSQADVRIPSLLDIFKYI